MKPDTYRRERSAGPADLEPDSRAPEAPGPDDQQDDGAGGRISPQVIIGSVRLVDVVLSALCAVIAYYVYWRGQEANWQLYMFVIGISAVLQVNFFQLLGVYRFNVLRQFTHQFGRLCAGWLLLFGSLIVIAYLTKTSELFSRLWLVMWFTFGLIGLGTLRMVLQLKFRKWARQGRLVRRVAVVGGGEQGQQLIRSLDRSNEADVELVGVFDDRMDRIPDTIEGYRKLGTVDQLIEFARSNRVDLIVVALPLAAETRVLEILQKLWVLPLDIRLSPQTNGLRFSPQSYNYVGDVPLLNVFDKPLEDWDHVLKSIEDRILSLAILTFVSPLLLFVAILIKLDSRGPVFFKQKRYGFNNELVEVYKFRTLYHEQRDENAERLVTRDDSRVTRVGAFLRRTSIDEIPQFINVLNGDMSIVGPRAHPIMAKAGEHLYQDVVDGYFARHRVKPGITGWAQVNGWRGETDTAEKIERRIEHDLYYIENWSIWFDLRIILMTPFVMADSQNTY